MRETFKSGVFSVITMPVGNIPPNSTAYLDLSLSAASNPKSMMIGGDFLAVDVVGLACGDRAQPIPEPDRTTPNRLTYDLGHVDTVGLNEVFRVEISNRTAVQVQISGALSMECRAPSDSMVFLHDRRRGER